VVLKISKKIKQGNEREFMLLFGTATTKIKMCCCYVISSSSSFKQENELV